MATPTLRSISELTNLAVSESSKQNLLRVDHDGYHDFALYAAKHGGSELFEISKRSRAIVLNFLADISNLSALERNKEKVNSGEASSEGCPKLLSIDTLNGYVQGLQMLLNKHGHSERFIYNPISDSASGNPTESDEVCLSKFRKRYRALLADMGLTEPKQANPLGVDEFLSLSKYVNDSNDIRDAEMMSVSLLGTNLILRFDEIVKLRMECVTLYPNNPKIKSILLDICKNNTYKREYYVETWGGMLSGSLKLDSFFVLLGWIIITGDNPGYLFCSISGSYKLNFEKEIGGAVFTGWLQRVLISGGESPESARGFRRHSIKRGGVKIWKSLGRHDVWIMPRMHATGFLAFQGYEYNNKGAWPKSTPEFVSMDALQNFAADAMISILVQGTELSLPEIACIDEEEED